MIGVLVAQPWLALVPAAVFFGLYRLSGRRLAGGTAVTWSLYAFYEYAMRRRWLCSGECNIRVDLLLLYPFLLLISIAAAVTAILAIVRHKRRLP